MAEDGYVYCPICMAVMPKHHDLEQIPQFRRVLDHLRSHSTWSIFWHYHKEYWAGVFRGRRPKLNDTDALDKMLSKFEEED